MNTPELRRLKLAWLAAKAAGDTQTQMDLLRNNPAEQEELIDFISGYYATGGSEADVVDLDAPLLPLTQRATQRALDRVFNTQMAFSTLAELRKSRQLSKVDVAHGLRLGVDVWNKFEEGAIELVSLSQRQLQRLSQFFQVNVDQFTALLDGSQPGVTVHRRQTREASLQEQGPQKQSLNEAIRRSAMSKEDKQFWLE